MMGETIIIDCTSEANVEVTAMPPVAGLVVYANTTLPQRTRQQPQDALESVRVGNLIGWGRDTNGDVPQVG